jgi:hypothetical protein
MTALREAGLDEQVASLGEHARLIRKPFTYNDLVAALHQVLHGAQHAFVLRSARARRD